MGPRRERLLWEAGVRQWDQLAATHAELLPPAVLPRLRAALDEMEEALSARDAERLAARLAPQERWRLFSEFGDEAVYLDIETDREHGITAIGLLDGRGPRILLTERERARFPDELAGARLLVTFNGSAFDVPVLRRAYPSWQAPEAHIDLRHLWARLGHHGGLKALEDATGLGRPPHLRGVRGQDAVWLWRRGQFGDRDALRLFAEYNLYDVINLRTLLALGFNRMLSRLPWVVAEIPVSHRGDVLYDVSKVLLGIGAPGADAD